VGYLYIDPSLYIYKRSTPIVATNESPLFQDIVTEVQVTPSQSMQIEQSPSTQHRSSDTTSGADPPGPIARRKVRTTTRKKSRTGKSVSYVQKRNRMTCPAQIHALFNASSLSFHNSLNVSTSPIFINSGIRETLNRDGFVVVPNVVTNELIQQLKRYVMLKMESEGVFDSSAYLEVGGPRHTIGLVTKYGWTKLDYVGPFQQILSSDAAIYLLICELLGATRLVPNFYEYKVSHPMSAKRKGNKFEFIHVDANYKKLLDLIDAGIDFTQLFYQIIIPITDMVPEGATVCFAKGFHKHWESITRNAIQSNLWTRRGWKATNPLNHITEEDSKRYITSRWTPVTAPSALL